MLLNELNQVTFKTIVIVLLTNTGYSQMGFKDYGALINNYNLEIDIQARERQSDCINNIPLEIRLVVKKNNLTSPIVIVNWKIAYLNCNEDTIIKSLSIDITGYTGIRRQPDLLSFYGLKIITHNYDVSIGTRQITNPDIIKKKVELKAPDYISGVNEITTGESVLLEVNGGIFPSGGKYTWYEKGCGTTFLGSGKSIWVKPIKTTHYFVRIESKNKFTSCISHTISINNNSIAATGIMGVDKFCKGSNKPIELTLTGGKLGLMANWVWYKDSITINNKIGSGQSITILPYKTTQYFARAEGSSNTTSFVTKKISLADTSVGSSKLVGSTEICQNENITLNIQGGQLSNDANWVWYKNSISINNNIYKSSNNTITIKLDETATLLVRAEGYCNVTPSTSVKISVKNKSISPNSIVIIDHIRDNKYKLKASGGSLGYNAKWNWFINDCIGSPISIGDELKRNISPKTKLYVKAIGDCNSTSCIPFFVPTNIKKNQYKIKFVNIGLTGISTNSISTGNITVGTKALYLRYKFPIINLGNAFGTTYSYNNDNNKIINYNGGGKSYYIFNNQKIFQREAYTAGVQMGFSNLKIYAGGGYGKSILYSGFDNFFYNYPDSFSSSFAKNNDFSGSGLELETGLNISIKHVNIIIGFNGLISKNPTYFDFTTGIGYAF